MQPSLLAPEPPWLPELLAALAKFEVLSRPQLAAIVRRDQAEVDRTLAELSRRGHAGILTGDVSRESGYRLTRKGALYLAELTGTEAPVARPFRATAMLGHELLKNDLAVVLALLDERGAIDLIRWETARDRIADAIHVAEGRRAERVPLVADAFVAIATETGPTALLVEIDTGTVSLTRMRKKLGAYVAWWRSGGPERRFGVRSLRVLTITPHAARIARLREAATEVAGSGAHGFLWFGKSDALDVGKPERLLEPQFLSAAPSSTPSLLFR